MSVLSESSFVPLEHFGLAWRWTRPTHAVLPAEVLACIRPLTAEAAATISAEAAARCRDLAAAAERFSAALDTVGQEPVRVQLAALPIPLTQVILISWATHLAVLTEWSVFIAYWDDFCYPSSDDISIWSPDAAWTVCYAHEEVFVFRPGG